jgi:hypothetical protein
MIAIVNVSPDSSPMIGINQYEVRINHSVICEFEHDRRAEGLAQCLRDAADAVESSYDKRVLSIIKLAKEGGL